MLMACTCFTQRVAGAHLLPKLCTAVSHQRVEPRVKVEPPKAVPMRPPVTRSRRSRTAIATQS